MLVAGQHCKIMCGVQRLTSGVSYVCQSNLSLPHLVMRPPCSPSGPGTRVTEYQRVLKGEVSSQHNAKPPQCVTYSQYTDCYARGGNLAACFSRQPHSSHAVFLSSVTARNIIMQWTPN